MEGTIRTMTQRRGAYRVRRVELDWYMVGSLALLACMLAVCAALVILSAPVPTDAETVRVMVRW